MSQGCDRLALRLTEVVSGCDSFERHMLKIAVADLMYFGLESAIYIGSIFCSPVSKPAARLPQTVEIASSIRWRKLQRSPPRP